MVDGKSALNKKITLSSDFPQNSGVFTQPTHTVSVQEHKFFFLLLLINEQWPN